MSRLPMNVLRMRAFPILKQLRLEETLLRTSSENWCIVNDGTDRPTVVMGISGKPTELVEVESVIKDDIPLIRRFSGGGTVIVDDKTIFVTYICNSDAIPGLQAYPRPIMSWTGQLYNEVFRGFRDFQLRENDYAFGNYKFGGNAQSITKHRWVHHTSFLWDYDKKNMEYLKIPTRAPEYRLARHHDEFLCPMKKYLQSRSTFIEKTVNAIGNHFSLKDTHLDAVTSSKTTYSPTTHLLARQELEAIVTSQSQPRDSRFLSASSN